ncbi:MAG TPA: aminotransferase class V-fold PLP-dependent enzyme [Cyclobacteriaceae bacterium]|nr:aminotransferase class V-fold PLP-dependent enzyme [Cyclobacteriaceae bacterium]
MISFYPGPSRVYDDLPRYVKAAHRKGILSMNHRSEEFMTLCEKTVNLLKDRLSIPNSYKIFFLSSATECWEVIGQSLVATGSHHIYNGAFGEKWFDYTKKIQSNINAHAFDREEILDPSRYIFDSGDVICITQNETSNGTQVPNDIIAQIRSNNPNHLVAVDATSSMAGIFLDFAAADVWFASVQKCFGLPAGLSLMICSPAALEKVRTQGEADHYNSMTLLNSMMDKWQTPCTPNVLAIYLLMRVMKDADPIDIVEARLRNRFQEWSKLLKVSDGLKPLIKNEAVRSTTVLAVEMQGKGDMGKLKTRARQAGFLLGEGYGDLKKSSFRIANFPALRRKEVQKLMRFLIRQKY